MNFFINMENIQRQKGEYEKNLIASILKYPKRVLYGIGESASYALKFFKDNNVEIHGIYDDNEKLNGTYYEGVLITLPEYERKDVAIIIVCSFVNQIRTKLLEFDHDIDNRLFILDGYFRENVDYDYFIENKEKIEYAYHHLEDEKSKYILDKLLEYRYLRDNSILKDFVETESKAYFDEVFLNNFKQGVIIDAGSYKGTFVEKMSLEKDTSNCMFYLFEPNRKFIEEIKIKLKDYNNYKIFNCALCDMDGEMEFTLMETSTSHLIDKKYSAYNIESKNKEIVKVSKLDNIITDELVTLIKVDIEGSEQAFIHGAKNTIVKNRPILLLSAYHKVSDLWELLYFLSHLNLGYKFYIRHYSLLCAKSILYCIPNTIL